MKKNMENLRENFESYEKLDDGLARTGAKLPAVGRILYGTKQRSVTG